MTLRVLLAEDNPGDVILVREALAAHHIDNDLKVVADGGEALRLINKIGKADDYPCPDVLLLDINLPRVNGLTILAAFRENPDCATTPVIVVTSSDSVRDRNSVASLGVSHYFRKPSDFEEFLVLGQVIKSVVKGQARQQAEG